MRCALILPLKQVDDSTRQLRELKTRKSKSPVAMAPTLEATLRNYLGAWKQNPSGLVFPSRNGRPRKRQYVVEVRIETRFAEAGAAYERRGPARLPAPIGHRGGRQKLGGLSKQGHPLLRFLWGEVEHMRCAGTVSCNGSTAAKLIQKDPLRVARRAPAKILIIEIKTLYLIP